MEPEEGTPPNPSPLPPPIPPSGGSSLTSTSSLPLASSPQPNTLSPSPLGSLTSLPIAGHAASLTSLPPPFPHNIHKGTSAPNITTSGSGPLLPKTDPKEEEESEAPPPPKRDDEEENNKSGDDGSGFSDPIVHSYGALFLADLKQQKLPTKERRYGLKAQKNCLSGKDVVQWIKKMEPSSTPEQCVEMAGHWLELGYLKFLPESPSSFQSAPSAWYRVPKKREEGETVVAAPSTGPSLADSQSMSLPKEEKKKTKKAVKPHLEGLTTEQLKQVILDTYDAMDQSSQERVVVELFARQKQNAAQQRTVEKKKEEKEKKEKKQKPEKEKKEKKQKPEKEKKDKDSSKETAPAAPVPTYFNLTLLEVMNKERERDEKALVPAVAPFLTNAIVKGGGLGCEGLFRISVFKNDLEDLEQQIESIDQEEWGEKISFETPHHPAALLKGWLRSFPEPVVPFELYDECVECGETEGDCDPIINKFPPDSRNLIYHICSFLRLISADKHSEVTFMTADNLAVVFAPGLIRSNSSDPLVAMARANGEKDFVKTLIQNLTLPSSPSLPCCFIEGPDGLPILPKDNGINTKPASLGDLFGGSGGGFSGSLGRGAGGGNSGPLGGGNSGSLGRGVGGGNSGPLGGGGSGPLGIGGGASGDLLAEMRMKLKKKEEREEKAQEEKEEKERKEKEEKEQKEKEEKEQKEEEEKNKDAGGEKKLKKTNSAPKVTPREEELSLSDESTVSTDLPPPSFSSRRRTATVCAPARKPEDGEEKKERKKKGERKGERKGEKKGERKGERKEKEGKEKRKSGKDKKEKEGKEGEEEA